MRCVIMPRYMTGYVQYLQTNLGWKSTRFLQLRLNFCKNNVISSWKKTGVRNAYIAHRMMQIKILEMTTSAVSIRNFINSCGCTFEAHNQVGNAHFISFFGNFRNFSIFFKLWKYLEIQNRKFQFLNKKLKFWPDRSLKNRLG